MTTYVFKEGKWVDKFSSPVAPTSAAVIGDIQPYQSMIDGSMITSRSKHREHLREHNCIEIGNESMQNAPQVKTDNRREILYAQLSNMSNNDANKILSKLRDDARFSNNPHRE